ncbi:ABC transporter permease [bacterium SCSIO 12741]|nr:ABC transporter permease [bacterium SCSIO 12741]
MLLKIAWRNVWRNKSRSAVVILAIAIGIFAAIFFAAFMTGMVNQQIDRNIRLETSHLQLCAKDFPLNEDLGLYLENSSQIVADLKSRSGVQSVTSRIVSNGMASTANKALGVRIMGVDPDQEKQTTRLWAEVDTGTYFEGKSRTAPILISQKQAEELKVRLKSKIVLDLPDRTGNVSRGLFRVVGIYKTGNGLFDGSSIFVKKEDLRPLLNFPEDGAHEIAVMLQDDRILEEFHKQVTEDYPNAEVRDWGELQPSVKMYSGFIDQFNFILLAIILIALIFGIINTMLMVIMERTHEIGMLRSIGMSKPRVAGMIILETMFLSLVGGIAGCLISIVVIGYLGNSGIDLTAYMGAMEDLGFSPIIYPEVEFVFYFQITIMVSITAIIAAWFPARRAIKLNPATAIREM